MHYISMERAVRVVAWLACATVLGMIIIFAATGVGQDPLQFVHTPDAYAAILLKDPASLRAGIALDNFFIVFYATMFGCLGVLLIRVGSSKAIVCLSMGLLLALAVLDMIENFHFMVMLSQAELGVMPSSTEISAQVVESLLKFHVSYLGLFLLGLALPRSTRLERTLSNLSLYLQLPVGVLIYVAPRALAGPLVFVRLVYFASALILVGAIFGARRARDDSNAPASHPGTMPSGAG